MIKGKAPVNKKLLKLIADGPGSTCQCLRVVSRSRKVPFHCDGGLSGGLATAYHRAWPVLFGFGETVDFEASSKDIAEQIDALGGTLASSTGLSSLTSTVSSSGLIENLDQTLDIFADVVRNPTFPTMEVEKYKARTLAQMQFQRSSPQFLAQEQFSKAIYGDHPGALVSPPVNSIRKLTSKDLLDFHSTYYRPNNSILAIVGDISLKEVLPKIEKAFGDGKKQTCRMTPAAPPGCAALSDVGPPVQRAAARTLVLSAPIPITSLLLPTDSGRRPAARCS